MTQTLLDTRKGDAVRVYVNHEWSTETVSLATARYVVVRGRWFDKRTGYERKRTDGSQSFCRVEPA